MVILDRIGPPENVMQQLRDRGLVLATLHATLHDDSNHFPWSIFQLMEKRDIYPPAAVVRVTCFGGELARAKNAGIWAVGITENSDEMELSAAEFAALGEDERERIREMIRSLYLDGGADAVIDSPLEILDAIDAINGLL